MTAAHYKKVLQNLFLSTLSILFISACSPSTPELPFDSDTWKNDLSGCLGNRLPMKEQVENIRLKILHLKERDIRPLLGKPDAEELLDRSNKIYIYYLTPGPKCKKHKTESEDIAWEIRFDALGTVRESNLVTE